MSLPLLVQAAALESVEAPPMNSFGEYQACIRLRVVSMLYPKLLQFLMSRYSLETRREIPGFGTIDYSFTISPINSKLIIIPLLKSYMLDGAPDNVPDNEFIIWDLISNRMCHDVTDAHSQFSLLALITSDGKKVIFRENDNHVSVWDMTSGEKLLDLGECCGGSMALSHDESQLVTTLDGIIFLSNIETGERIKQIPNHAAYYDGSLAISPDGKRIAVFNKYLIHIIDALTEHEVAEIKCGGNAYTLNFSLDGTKIVANVRLAGCTFSRSLWDIASGEELSKKDYGNIDIQIRGNKRIEIEYEDPSRKVYDDSTDQLLCSDKGSEQYAVSDQWYVVVGKLGKKIYIYDLDKLTAFHRVIASLSDLQLELIDRIRVKAELNKKLLNNKLILNRKLVRIISEYETLPDPIKGIVQKYVTFKA